MFRHICFSKLSGNKQKGSSCLLSVTLLLASVFFCIAESVYCRTYDGVLAESVPLGAWLYARNCLECHDKYASSRLAEIYNDSNELIAAIGEQGCKIAWARSRGGSLGSNELAALAAYMQKWEELGDEPQLPALPPQSVHTVAAPPPKVTAAEKNQTTSDTVPNEEQLSPPLAHLIATNPVAAGGFLYTRNCFRCHLSYEQARMGRGISKELVLRFITEGKTSTQMRAFSRMLGGPLKGTEIREIVTYISTWEERGEPPAIADILMTPPAIDPSEFIPIRLTRFQQVKGDAAEGSLLFRRNCSICHGPKGEGYVAPPLRTKQLGIRPDIFIKSVMKTGVPGSLMKGWDSGRGGILSAKDIDDITSAILALDMSPP
ncbi:c-type cytochrome [Desulfopila aestuarii]|uniref:Cytochrome c553 n=1 Tax=Desulfopila aestuarii DSM 18488 TaxID=1121416 RepID=A0A1M7Y9M6_9BACT|nr:c-type cytochrome [Desulfopila aestuarii]SHO49299.1 Cytochrome c553 [Desulfopila aestuarii DSM 18488]